MAWTAETLAAAAVWSLERSRGWLDGIVDCASGNVRPVPPIDYEKTPSDFRITDPAARWAFGYAEAVRHARRTMDQEARGQAASDWDWAQQPQEALIQEVRRWWGAGDDPRGVPKPDEQDWRYEEAFPVAVLLQRFGGPEKAMQWFRDECVDAQEDYSAGYGYLLVQEQEDPIVISLVNGEPYVWDGWHRLGAAIVRSLTGNGQPMVKAIVGEPKPALTLDAVVPDDAETEEQRMAQTPEKLMAWYGEVFGSSRSPRDMLAAKLERLDQIVADLKASPIAANIRVFGSAATQLDLIPGDIDVFIEGPYAIQGDELASALRQLLLLAVKGGYQGNYGNFDPFRLVRPANGDAPYLATRSDGYTGVCWVRADRATARQIVADGREGVPILEFSRVFREEFAAALDAAPDPEAPSTAFGR